MYICLVVALLATFLWINILVAEYISAKMNPYLNEENKISDYKRSKFKTYLIIIMATFWAAVIKFF